MCCAAAVAALGSVCFTSCLEKGADKARLGKVVVYAYDSFIGEWGPGPKLEELFEAETGYDLEFVDCGDGVQILSRAIFEKNAPVADVLIGIDNNLVQKAANAKILAEYKPKNAEKIIPAPLSEALGNDWRLTPFDWSQFAMIYDTQSNVPAPKSLADLTNDVYRKKIILLDPRTSTPGLGFAAWTVATFKETEAFADFWRKLKPNILTLSPSWSSGYGLFTNGEAPLVISYTTSPAYHVEYDETDRYQALIFDEPHVMQVEGAGVVRGAPNEKGAKAFIDFLISKEAQEQLPLTQWMYPANSEVPLPDSYKKAAPVASQTVQADSAAVEEAVKLITSILAE